MSLWQKISGFASRVRNNPYDLIKYVIGYGGATALSWVVGANISSYLESIGYGYESNALLSFVVKTGVFYLVNLPVYSVLHKKSYSSGKKDWKEDIKHQAYSNFIGSKWTLTGLVAHWGLMRAFGQGSALAFIVGNVIGMGISTLMKLKHDARNGIIVRN